MGLHLAVIFAASSGDGDGWLEQVLGDGPLLPKLIGGGSGLVVVAGALFYIMKFQSTFTTKLEETDEKKDRRIASLERRVGSAEASERRCQYRLAHMGRLLVQHGIPWEEPSFPWEASGPDAITADADPDQEPEP